MRRFWIISLFLVGTISKAESAWDIPDGVDFNIAEIIYPSLHITMAGGSSDGEPEELAVGGHDPSRDFTVQGIEAGLSLRLNDYIQGFGAINFSYGADEEWEDEVEEAFGKLTKLPGNLEIRGGRMLSRFGILNANHQHAWNAVDVPLVNGRFLGDDGLSTEGGDLTWYPPTSFKSALTVSYGDARAHGHGHGAEEEGHDEEGPSEEAEESGYEDKLFTANALVQIPYNDFHRYDAGASYAQGDNGLGDDTRVYGVHFAYHWRENGLEPGGRTFTWNNEFFIRDIGQGEGGHGHGHEDEEEEHHEEEEEEHDEDEASADDEIEFGFYSEVIYGPNQALDLGLRVGFVEGIEAFNLGERFRISPLATIYLSESRNLFLRLQYNYDDLEHDEAHSVWAQLQYSFG